MAANILEEPATYIFRLEKASQVGKKRKGLLRQELNPSKFTYYPKDGSSRSLQNVRNHLPDCTSQT
jgi:hypothetical protein